MYVNMQSIEYNTTVFDIALLQKLKSRSARMTMTQHQWCQATACEGLSQGPYKVRASVQVEPILSALQARHSNELATVLQSNHCTGPEFTFQRPIKAQFLR